MHMQVTDAQLQVTSVPGSRYQYKPSQPLSLTTPNSALHSGVSTAFTQHQHARFGTPAALSHGATSKLAAAGTNSYTTTSFSPKMVTPLPVRGQENSVR